MPTRPETKSGLPLNRRTRASIVIGVLSSLLLFSGSHPLSKSRLENISQDYLTRLARQNTRLPSPVKVILIDENTLQYMEPKVGRWPWPRRVFKDIIEFINLGEARAIHFDILFSEREGNNGQLAENDDAILSQSSADAGNIIHAMQLLRDDDNSQPSVALPAVVVQQATVQQAIEPLNRDPTNSVYQDYLAPYPELLQSSLGVGVVNASVDPDGIYRSTRPFYRYDDKLLPSLSISGAMRLNDKRILDRVNNAKRQQAAQLVNFYDEVPAYSLSGILESAAQLQNGDTGELLVNPGEFSDSYVFIGASAIGLHDLKATPLNALTPGVFVHAAYLANILTDDLLQVVNPAALYLILPLLALTIAFTVLHSRYLTIQFITPLVIAGAYAIAAYALRTHNLQIAFITPILCIIASSIGAYAYLYSVEERERKQVRAMFSRFVSPAALSVLLNQMENARSAASGTREFITVLFCDMRGFTSLSEKLPAEEIVRILNHYFTVMTDIIFRHNGTVDKFIGDAIMATWGAPLPSHSHALDAVRCADAMRAAIPDINQWLQKQDLPSINIGIGIHSGDAIMGSLGSQQKADFTVIGDTVNMSSRLEGITKVYQRTIIISEDTWREIHSQIDCQLLDCVKVKGKHVASRIYSPLGDSPAPGNFDNKRIGIQTQQAFELYGNKQWSACLELLEKLPPHAKLPHLEQRCHEYLEQSPGQDWEPVYILRSK